MAECLIFSMMDIGHATDLRLGMGLGRTIATVTATPGYCGAVAASCLYSATTGHAAPVPSASKLLLALLPRPRGLLSLYQELPGRLAPGGTPARSISIFATPSLRAPTTHPPVPNHLLLALMLIKWASILACLGAAPRQYFERPPAM
jgi:hypothetical protein